jgi:hypothetical protein
MFLIMSNALSKQERIRMAAERSEMLEDAGWGTISDRERSDIEREISLLKNFAIRVRFDDTAGNVVAV